MMLGLAMLMLELASPHGFAACVPDWRDEENDVGAPPSPASTLRRPSRVPTAAAAILALLGLVLFGQGVWIHAKALLAQVLLERAFAASLAHRRSRSSRGPGPTPGRSPASRCRGCARARSCSRARAGRRSPSGPAMSSARRRPASPAPRSMRRIATRSFAFLGEVRIGDEIRVTRRDGARVSLPRDRHVGRALGCVRHRSRTPTAAISCSRPAGRSTRSSPARCAISCKPGWMVMLRRSAEAAPRIGRDAHRNSV